MPTKIDNFADRVLRDALRDPNNLREFLELVLGGLASRIDTDSVEYDERELPLPDLHRRQPDLFCRLRFDHLDEMLVCVLIEHQSRSDHAMPIRVHEYSLGHWRQLWEQTSKDRRARLPGILPVVFYTAASPWPTHRTLSDIVEAPSWLPPVVPDWPICYVNLAELHSSELLRSDRPFQHFLAVARAAAAPSTEAFGAVLGTAAQRIDALADSEPDRHWRLLELILWWTTARRQRVEHARHYCAVVDNIRPAHRDEVLSMSKQIYVPYEEEVEQRAEAKAEAMAEAMAQAMAQAEVLDRCRTLLRSFIEKRFGAIPEALNQRIEALDDVEQIQAPLREIFDIDSLDQLSI